MPATAWKERDPYGGAHGPTYRQTEATYLSYRISAHMSQSKSPPPPDMVADWIRDLGKMNSRQRVEFFYSHCPLELQT